MSEPDPYRIEHAQICLRCETIQIEKRGGLRAMICGKCHKEMNVLFKHWKKYGLYATTKDENERPLGNNAEPIKNYPEDDPREDR